LDDQGDALANIQGLEQSVEVAAMLDERTVSPVLSINVRQAPRLRDRALHLADEQARIQVRATRSMAQRRT